MSRFRGDGVLETRCVICLQKARRKMKTRQRRGQHIKKSICGTSWSEGNLIAATSMCISQLNFIYQFIHPPSRSEVSSQSRTPEPTDCVRGRLPELDRPTHHRNNREADQHPRVKSQVKCTGS